MDRCWCGIVVLAAIMSSTTMAADSPSTTPQPASEPAPLPPTDAAPLLLRSEREVSAPLATGAPLRGYSQQAFHRGLLPLTDFLEHLAVAEEMDVRRVTVALPEDSAPSSSAVLSALQPRRAALRVAVRQMEAFRQPAAANWHADLLLGKYVLAQAEEEAARFAGDPVKVDQATRSQSSLAIEHYQRRVFDARILGHASLPEVTRAVSFLNIDPTQKRRTLRQAVGTTQRWNAVGSGIGRTDRVLESQLQVTMWDAETRTTKPNDAILRRGLVDADRLSSQLFAKQQEYYTHGTATLADLSRAWQTRRQVHLLADWVDAPLPTSSPSSHARELRELTGIAESVHDRRGRHASDVEYVRVLRSLHATDFPHRRDISSRQ